MFEVLHELSHSILQGTYQKDINNPLFPGQETEARRSIKNFPGFLM